MFFLIRTIFWLTIVFSSMSWTIGTSQPRSATLRDALVEHGLAMAGAVKDVAIDQARAWCVRSADQCVADAARLTALVSAHESDDVERLELPPSVEPALPLPPRDPRRL